MLTGGLLFTLKYFEDYRAENSLTAGALEKVSCYDTETTSKIECEADSPFNRACVAIVIFHTLMLFMTFFKGYQAVTFYQDRFWLKCIILSAIWISTSYLPGMPLYSLIYPQVARAATALLLVFICVPFYMIT